MMFLVKQKVSYFLDLTLTSIGVLPMMLLDTYNNKLSLSVIVERTLLDILYIALAVYHYYYYYYYHLFCVQISGTPYF